MKVIQGWECPKCGEIYSPYTTKCQDCTKKPVANRTIETTNKKDMDEVEQLKEDLCRVSNVANCDHNFVGAGSGANPRLYCRNCNKEGPYWG